MESVLFLSLLRRKVLLNRKGCLLAVIFIKSPALPGF